MTLLERGLFSLLHFGEDTAVCVTKRGSSKTEAVALVECDEAVHSAGHTAAEPSIKEYKIAFPSTCHLRTVWSYKYEHRSSVNIMPF